MESYQADNGKFAELSFREAISEVNQVIAFCGVGFYHQNEIIKRYF